MQLPLASSDPALAEPEALRRYAVDVIDTESAAIAALRNRIDEHFVAACQMLLGCSGRIVVTGVGKSGHIGRKLAATLASTGSPAFFVHAAEASHGDLGMLQTGDVVIVISYSGSSDEILGLVAGIKHLNIPLISLCGLPTSALAVASDVCINISVEREACPLGLAPTASTTCSLAMGDALAVTLSRARGFAERDFALSHPGGRLGKRLSLTVADVMIQGPATPIVDDTVFLAEALLEITKKGLGIVLIVDSASNLAGVFTDGDLRRSLDRNEDIRTMRIRDVMTAGGKRIEPTVLAADAVTTMQEYRISALPVVAQQSVMGVVTMHALITAGVV